MIRSAMALACFALPRTALGDAVFGYRLLGVVTESEAESGHVLDPVQVGDAFMLEFLFDSERAGDQNTNDYWFTAIEGSYTIRVGPVDLTNPLSYGGFHMQDDEPALGADLFSPSAYYTAHDLRFSTRLQYDAGTFQPAPGEPAYAPLNLHQLPWEQFSGGFFDSHNGRIVRIEINAVQLIPTPGAITPYFAIGLVARRRRR